MEGGRGGGKRGGRGERGKEERWKRGEGERGEGKNINISCQDVCCQWAQHVTKAGEKAGDETSAVDTAGLIAHTPVAMYAMYMYHFSRQSTSYNCNHPSPPLTLSTPSLPFHPSSPHQCSQEHLQHRVTAGVCHHLHTHVLHSPHPLTPLPSSSSQPHLSL